MNHEAALLKDALCYEQGHPRRTQHILKVYALVKLLGECADLPSEQQQILQAAAILHDIAIKYCKEHCGGNACQENQRKAAPSLVRDFLHRAHYPDEWEAHILQLVLDHHCYDEREDPLLQLLIEADLMVNCWEQPPTPQKLQDMQQLFVSKAGKQLFALQAQALGPFC